MKDYLVRTLLLTLILVPSLFLAQPVSAQTEGLQIAPAVIEDKVEPGKTYRFSVKVTNMSDAEKTFYLLVQDIVGTDDGGVPIFAEESNEPTPYELSSWITLSRSMITLRAGQSADVPFTVQVPQDASPGAHFGGVFFDVRPEQLSQTGAAVGARVGTIVNLRTAGDVREEVLLREFSTEKFVYSAPPVTFTTRIENLGNVLARPHGGIEITDMFGKMVGNIEVNPSGAAVFPGTNRDYAATWQHDGFAFGRYQALLSIVYGEEGRQTVVRATSFWVLPLKPILIILGSLLAAILLVYGLVKRHIRRRLQEMGARSGDAGGYARRYNRPVSRLTFVATTVLIFSLVLLLILFAMFA